MTKKTIKVVVVEDDQEFEIVAAVNTPADALEKMTHSQPDILLTDYTLPGMTGLELCLKVKEKYPHIKRVILSMHDEGHLVKQIMKAGVDGYLLKSIQQAELKNALRQMMQGMPYVSPEITKQLMAGLTNEGKQDLLTEREQEILRLIVKEFSNKQIADKLFISERWKPTAKTSFVKPTPLL